MYKKGFTLQELLISMAVIGIIAAAIAPAFNAIIPDKKKSMYIKAYNTLTNLTSAILDDPTLYWIEYDETTYKPKCYNMFCTSKPVNYKPCNETDWECTSNEKFPMIFATKINYVERNKKDSNGATTIKSTDGVLWSFKTTSDAAAKTIKTELTIDVDYNNDNKKNKCTYKSDTCPNPDQFTFEIDNDGGILATDPLGKAFLKNPTDMNSVRQDKEYAKTLQSKK